MRKNSTFNASSLGNCPFLFLLLIFLTSNILSQSVNDYTIISQNQNEIVIEYTPYLLQIDTLKPAEISQLQNQIDLSQPVLSFLFLNTSIDNPQPGNPQIPVRIFPLILKSETGNQIEVLESSYVEFDGVRLKPMPALISEKQVDNALGDTISYLKVFSFGEIYSKNNFMPEEIVELGEVGVARNYIITQVKVYPVQYNPALGKVRLYKKIKFVLRYGQGQSQFLSPDKFDFKIADGFVNHEIAKNWKINFANRVFAKPQNSQLASGDWYKIPIVEEGIYRITYTDLRNAGINPDNIDPRTIKIFNNGGFQLPENINDPRPDGLIENAIYVFGEDDGKFDQSDYIIFYGRGTSGWNYNPTTKEFTHYVNDYTNENYYFLTFGGARGKRMMIVQSLNSSNAFKPEYTFGLYFRDDQKINLTESGREWFMSSVEARAGFNMVNYVTKLDELLPGKPVRYRIQVASRAGGPNWFVIKENDNDLGTINLGTVALSGYTALIDYYAVKSEPKKFIYNGEIKDSRSNLKFYFNWVGEAVAGYVDWFEIVYPRTFKAVNDFISFYSYDTSAVVEYKVYGFSSNDVRMFDVTDFGNVKMISGNVNAGEFVFQVLEQAGQVRHFIGVGANGYKRVSKIEKVKNTNLRGETEGADWIVITHPDFISQAKKLAEHRAKKDSLKTLVVDVTDIYNEFSSGMLDPVAIRDFLKFAFDRWNKKPFYVLLFGDGDYDYKNVEVADKNWIPSYESKEGLQQIWTYTSDDFYVLLTPDPYIDMAIGRLPVQTQDEAEIIVNKIIQYENNSDFGMWRNTILFAADDGLTSGDNTDGQIHTLQSESLANYYTPDYIDKRKIYLVSYPTVYTSVGRRKPDAAKALVDYINRGCAIVNWIGHGNPFVWAHERIFEIGYTIQNLKNENRLPFVVAATCDFGRFDNPKTQSSTEVLLTLKNGGAIGVLTSARLVYSSDNAAFNYKFFDELFKSTPEYKTTRLGDAMFRVKQVYASLNDLKFILFADPALRLTLPRYSAVVDTINGKDQNQVVQLKALGKVNFSGRVQKNDREMLNVSGNVEFTLFDAQKRLTYLDEKGWIFNFVDQGNLLFKGVYSVKNGNFKGEFMLPKDISFSNERAKAIAYFYGNGIDGVGFAGNIVINGIDSNFVGDFKGPEIEIFLNNKSFKSGDVVSNEATLIVEIFDESGVNVSTSAIGHRIEAFIDDNPTGIDLSEFYKTKPDDYKRGEIVYKLPTLSPGKHRLKVKAWDIFNNSSSSEVEFKIAESGEFAIYNVFNYPNPFSDKTYFTFQKVAVENDVPVDVEIKIYTLSGKLINKIERFGLTGNFIAIEWDGKDMDGDEISNGVYIYKVIVKTFDGLKKAESIGKLVVMR
ncbi:type IX secretion system sortase PorU [Candidatus Chrysopegis kryptomonas]|uniref:Por secretion system C-terminal sorting domain-containing protein n=1 Tax=Candidatus Chryseopegocella kryptomonas TaxID=1633643 RepID=A0A0N7MW31_9BACT|nr:type IX secretion system sortase PorU [Candidatus Chrysopegis kryptomonas]CUS97507.1 Por secretion system C-terminal sorting domain-containing protein [Candidatus Chrysopegis kryptomonas]